jgi:FtsH-binding integral membrane protein
VTDADHRMSKQAFVGLITVFTLAGIIFAMLIGSLSYGWNLDGWNKWAVIGFFIGVLLVTLGGTTLYITSDKPALSLLGYSLVAGPFGLMLGPIVALYTPGSVAKVAGITIALVVVLGLVGICIPESLEKFGAWLLIALIVLILGYFIVPVLGLFGVDVESGMRALDWIGVALFGAIVVYDMNRAMRVPRTLDKAIDCAAGLFTDIVNIFIRLLSLLGQTKSSS